jgi:acyl-CoA thioesterase-2
VERLLRRLELATLGPDRFSADPGPGEGRLFGGLVAAQAVVAAGRTLGVGDGRDARFLHSLHAYFLRPGTHESAIELEVDRIRDGRTFTTRRVVARQSDEAIFELAASFARPEAGIEHQDPAPEAPEPEGLPDWEDLRARLLGDRAERRPDGPIEMRTCDPENPADPTARLPARRRVWIRPRGGLPEDPLLHAALLVYASDRMLISTAARPHGIPFGQRRGASLDHALWIHAPVRFDDWHLYASESPVARAARGLVLGAIYSRRGERIASVAQEGLIRTLRTAGA